MDTTTLLFVRWNHVPTCAPTPAEAMHSSKAPKEEPRLSQKIRSLVGQAVAAHSMISEGDRILVGLSGGKDSLILLLALHHLRQRSPVSFSLKACTVNPTGETLDTSVLASLCDRLEVPFRLVEHDIFGIIRAREERSPCSFCAHLRRGLLNTTAREEECNLLALGHHLDDVVETVFLNLLEGGRFRCFKPKLWHSRTGITVIRPLVFVEEARIAREVLRLSLNPLDMACPFSGKSRRAGAKKLVERLCGEQPSLRSNILHALTHFQANDIWTRND